MSFETDVELVPISRKLQDAIIRTLSSVFEFEYAKVELQFNENKVVIVTLRQKVNDVIAKDLLEKINNPNEEFKENFNDNFDAPNVVLKSASAISKYIIWENT